MQFVCVLQNITFCSLFTNCLKPFHDFNYNTVASIIHPSFEMRCFVLVMSFASFFDSFKILPHCRHICCISVRHYLIMSSVRCNLCGLLAYLATISVAGRLELRTADLHTACLLQVVLTRLFIKARCRLLK